MEELTQTRYAVDGHVATITFDRPERLNAWTPVMNREYRALLAEAEADPAVRAIVVTGAGRGFCAGAETDDLAGHAERGAYDDGQEAALPTPGQGADPRFDAELAYHFGIGKPIIAAVNGPAAGIGFAFMCYCDLRVVSRTAKLTSAHGRLGLPAAFGLAWLLPRLVGGTRAVDVLFTSRTFSGEEAGEMGLATRVAEPEDVLAEALALAHQLATTVSPASLAVTKRQLYLGFHQSVGEAVGMSEAWLSPMMGGPDYAEGVAALRERRAADYSGVLPAGWA